MPGIIVSKYGGSSVTSPDDIKRIKEITYSDPRRKVIVVSAPGKRDSNDVKVTDMLIELAKTGDKSLARRIMERYYQLWSGHNLEHITKILHERMKQTGLGPNAYSDSLKAFGEEACARTLAAAMGAKYVDPKEFLVVSPDFGDARVLPESYEKIKELAERKGVLVLPGFYGYTEDGRIATMSRGGSDLTGSVVAAGLDAKEYENFTDVPGIFAADPRIVKNPRKIDVITYEEMEALAYFGSKLHSDSIAPAEDKKTPIHIRSFGDYPKPGTLVVTDRKVDPNRPIVGVAYQPGFCSFDVNRKGYNDERGTFRIIAEVFEKRGISIEQLPSITKNVSVFLRESQFEEKDVTDIIKELERVVGERTEVTLQDGMGYLVIAGKGLKGHIGISSDVTGALAKARVNIRCSVQDSKERCMTFGINEQDGDLAVRTLYDAFLR